MLLVDKIQSISDSEITCEKTFTSDEPFVQGHFPDFALVPGVILCESCLQAGNAFYMTGKMTLNGKLAVRLDFACSVAPTAAE